MLRKILKNDFYTTTKAEELKNFIDKCEGFLSAKVNNTWKGIHQIPRIDLQQEVDKLQLGSQRLVGQIVQANFNKNFERADALQKNYSSTIRERDQLSKARKGEKRPASQIEDKNNEALRKKYVIDGLTQIKKQLQKQFPDVTFESLKGLEKLAHEVKNNEELGQLLVDNGYKLGVELWSYLTERDIPLPMLPSDIDPYRILGLVEENENEERYDDPLKNAAQKGDLQAIKKGFGLIRYFVVSEDRNLFVRCILSAIYYLLNTFIEIYNDIFSIEDQYLVREILKIAVRNNHEEIIDYVLEHPEREKLIYGSMWYEIAEEAVEHNNNQIVLKIIDEPEIQFTTFEFGRFFKKVVSKKNGTLFSQLLSREGLPTEIVEKWHSFEYINVVCSLIDGNLHQQLRQFLEIPGVIEKIRQVEDLIEKAIQKKDQESFSILFGYPDLIGKVDQSSWKFGLLEIAGAHNQSKMVKQMAEMPQIDPLNSNLTYEWCQAIGHLARHNNPELASTIEVITQERSRSHGEEVISKSDLWGEALVGFAKGNHLSKLPQEFFNHLKKIKEKKEKEIGQMHWSNALKASAPHGSMQVLNLMKEEDKISISSSSKATALFHSVRYGKITRLFEELVEDLPKRQEFLLDFFPFSRHTASPFDILFEAALSGSKKMFASVMQHAKKSSFPTKVNDIDIPKLKNKMIDLIREGYIDNLRELKGIKLTVELNKIDVSVNPNLASNLVSQLNHKIPNLVQKKVNNSKYSTIAEYLAAEGWKVEINLFDLLSNSDIEELVQVAKNIGYQDIADFLSTLFSYGKSHTAEIVKRLLHPDTRQETKEYINEYFSNEDKEEIRIYARLFGYPDLLSES